jgi:hypothetical protein
MEGAVEAGLEVAQQRVDPADLRQIAGVLPKPLTAVILA